jgi:hypothetical protein
MKQGVVWLTEFWPMECFEPMKRNTDGLCLVVPTSQPASSRACLLVCGMVLSFALGCGPAVPDGMVRVRGQVLHAASPLPDGTILFEAVNGTASGAGRIMKDGHYESLMPPGDYKVAVRSYDGVSKIGDDRKRVQPKSRIPERFGSVLTSEIIVTVTPPGDRVDINLGK